MMDVLSYLVYFLWVMSKNFTQYKRAIFYQTFSLGNKNY